MAGKEDINNQVEESFSHIPSTEKSTWDAVYNIGDKVRIRKDMALGKYQIDNLYEIKSYDVVKDFIRKENPTGRLYYLLPNGSWEGKDLEFAFKKGLPKSIINTNITTITGATSNQQKTVKVNSLDKDIVQGLLDDFVVQNDADISRVSRENPPLFDAVLAALDLLANKFGTGNLQKPIIQQPIVQPKQPPQPPINDGSDLVGKMFQVVDDPKITYTITKVENDLVYFTWFYDGSYLSGFRSINSFNSNLADGTWVIVTPPQQTVNDGSDLVGKDFKIVGFDDIGTVISVKDGVLDIAWNVNGNVVRESEKAEYFYKELAEGRLVEVTNVRQPQQPVVKPTKAIKAPKTAPVRVPVTPPVIPPTVSTQPTETEEELLESIEGLELMADIDPTAKADLKILKARLKELRKKNP